MTLPARRRWHQFTTRSLLIVTALLAWSLATWPPYAEYSEVTVKNMNGASHDKQVVEVRLDAKPADQITLLENVEAIDGPSDQYGPIEVPGMSCSDKPAVTAAFDAIERDTKKRLAAITLADLRAVKAA